MQNNFISKKILYLFIASPGLFLLINNYPYIMVFFISISLLISGVFFIIKRRIAFYHSSIIAFLLIIFLYFILSYFFSNQILSNFLSYDFLKNDGNFFFCYLPFFILAVPFFNYEIVSKIYFKFIFFAFFTFALIAAYYVLTNNYTSQLFIYNVARGQMFVALNFAHNDTCSF